MSDERARELLAGARDACERERAGRLRAEAALAEHAIAAMYGRAVLALLEQVSRLRRAAASGEVDFDMSPSGVAKSLGEELHEAMGETPGSSARGSEFADVLGCTLQLFVGEFTEAQMLEHVNAGARRLRRRLDLVADGHTWQDAKDIEASEAVAP